MSDQYPLTKSLGLEWLAIPAHGTVFDGYVRASDLETLLEKGVKVKCGIEEATEQDKNAGWLADETGTHRVYTHVGLLIPLQPIVKDSAESLLREWVERCNTGRVNTDLYKRARKLLEGK